MEIKKYCRQKSNLLYLLGIVFDTQEVVGAFNYMSLRGLGQAVAISHIAVKIKSGRFPQSLCPFGMTVFIKKLSPRSLFCEAIEYYS